MNLEQEDLCCHNDRFLTTASFYLLVCLCSPSSGMYTVYLCTYVVISNIFKPFLCSPWNWNLGKIAHVDEHIFSGWFDRQLAISLHHLHDINVQSFTSFMTHLLYIVLIIPIFEHMKTCWNELTGRCKKMASLKTPRLCRQRCHTQTRLVGRCLGMWGGDIRGENCQMILQVVQGVSKNRGKKPKSSILTGFSMKYTIHFQVPLFLETPIYT